MNKDIVYLIWNCQTNNIKYKIAILYKLDNKYFFEYNKEELKAAMKFGFRPLVAFPNINAIYVNNNLFLAFSSRLPDKSRPEIQKILSTFGLEKYDEFELLKRSGAKLPTDNLEFAC